MCDKSTENGNAKLEQNVPGCCWWKLLNSPPSPPSQPNSTQHSPVTVSKLWAFTARSRAKGAAQPAASSSACYCAWSWWCCVLFVCRLCVGSSCLVLRWYFVQPQPWPNPKLHVPCLSMCAALPLFTQDGTARKHSATAGEGSPDAIVDWCVSLSVCVLSTCLCAVV